MAAALRVHDSVSVVDKFQDEFRHFFQLADFREHELVVRLDDEALAVFFKAEQAVPGHVILNFRHHGLGNGVAALAFQALQHLGCPKSGGGGIPEGKMADAVGVEVLGTLHQLRKGSDGVAGGFIIRIVHLDHDFEVALDDDGAVTVHKLGKFKKRGNSWQDGAQNAPKTKNRPRRTATNEKPAPKDRLFEPPSRFELPTC